MVLTTEQRVELMAKARLAKANKKLTQETPVVNVEPPVEQPPTPKVKKTRKKNEIAPLPEPVQLIQESESEEEVEPEPVVLPVIAPKKSKTLPVKWLKKTQEPQKCCEEKVCKEEPLLSDEKPQIVKHIVIPPMKELKKQRQPRASSRTLEIVAEPKAIEEVLDEVKNNDMKYRATKKVAPAPVASAPINIKYVDPPLQLFSY